MSPGRDVSRRRLLSSLGTVSLAAFAGCTDSSGETPEESPADTQPAGQADTPTPTPNPTATASATPTDTSTATDTPTATHIPTTTTTPIHSDYETTTVRVTTPDGEELGSVTAAIADTGSLRFTGLSETESLPEDRGMLFVYDEAGDHTFVMREMDFAIDIVYADSDGTITKIHHAKAPGPDEDGSDQRYPGYGQYVLEVNYEWTSERDIEEGDVLDFDL